MCRAVYRNIPVEVLGTYEIKGETYAAIRVTEGKPFFEWKKMPISTEYKTVRLNELSDFSEEPKPLSEKSKMLAMALAYKNKKQWYSGESVWLWRNCNQGVFLKEQNGFVNLCLTDEPEYVIVFWLNPDSWDWEISRNIGVDYFKWVDYLKGKEC